MSRFASTCSAAVLACCSPARHTAPPAGPMGAAPGAVVLGQPGSKPRATPAPAMPGKNVPAIKVNTVGYPTSWPKLVIFNVEPRRAVVKDGSGAVALEIAPDAVQRFGRDRASQDEVWQVDVSALSKPGTYRIVSDGAESDPFVVAEAPYRQALVLAQKMFYFQRTRTKLELPFAEWEGDHFVREGISHAHSDVGWLFEEYPKKRTKWPLEAGWHDAGNYDMYVPSTAPSAQGLLLAYEQYPERFADGDANIPESGNGVPDVLDEAAWGLRWVLSMQTQDGGFRVREANAMIGEPGSTPPDRDRTARWVDRVGSASTAKGVSLAAVCARVYERHDPALATRCRQAALRGWSWLERHPERLMVPPVGRAATENAWQLWDDGPKVASDNGARFIAAAEMYRTFRTPSALESIKRLLDAKETAASELERGHWANLSRWGLTTLAKDTQAPGEVRDEAKRRLLEAVAPLRPRVERDDGYRCATSVNDYYWGSNANLAEKATMLLVAAELDPAGHAWALAAARDQWHWLLGRNPNGFSAITRVGTGPNALYHMEWGPKYPKVPPGYLIDGPNAHDMGFLAPGAPAKAQLWESPRDLSSGVKRGELWHWAQSDLWESGFVDPNSWDKGWWCVTEPDIYYNAVLVLFAAALGMPTSAG